MPLVLSQNMFKDATLYYDREDFLKEHKKISQYLEIGVLAGDYSDLVIKYLNPDTVDLLDHYTEEDWNQEYSPRFDKNNHYSFMIEKYKNIKNVNIIKQFFHPALREINKIYDYIYLDANHYSEFMDAALEFSKHHSKAGSIIGINDYMIYDFACNEYYGTVQSVNKFLVNNDNWNVCGYALGAGMHPDIYLQRLV